MVTVVVSVVSGATVVVDGREEVVVIWAVVLWVTVMVAIVEISVFPEPSSVVVETVLDDP